MLHLRGGGCCTSKLHPEPDSLQPSGNGTKRFIQDLDSSEARMLQDSEPERPESAYFDCERLLESVESGAVAPVRGSFVIDLHRRGGCITRRQDLPPAAFWTGQELRALYDRIRGYYGATASEKFGLIFVALSCMSPAQSVR